MVIDVTDSRLEKLIKLLASKNDVIRQQAAIAIGQIQQTRPEAAAGLLTRLHQCLQKANSAWDTRVAAAQACAHVLSAIPPTESLCIEDNDELVKFRLEDLIRTKQPLLSSAIGQNTPVETSIDRKTQRMQVDQHLELHPQIGIDSRAWIGDDDMIMSTGTIHSLSPKLESLDEDDPSCATQLTPIVVDLHQIVTDRLVAVFCIDLLCRNIVDHNWEVRHGAALGLCVCVTSNAIDRLTNRDRRHISRRLLQVLALDRFNDFVGGSAVAPVRETCAQALSAILAATTRSISLFDELIDAIMQLLDCSTLWECRQSGLLVLKYTFPLCPNARRTFLPTVVRLLADSIDEVSSAATQALVPLCADQTDIVFADDNRLLESVWSLMQRSITTDACAVDATVCGLIRLVHCWLTRSTTTQLNEQQLTAIVELLESSSTIVRQLSAECIEIAIGRTHTDQLSDDQLIKVLIALYRRMLFEPFESSQRLLSVVIRCSSMIADRFGDRLVDMVCPFAGAWLACLMIGDDAPTIDIFACKVNRSMDETPQRQHIAGSDICALGVVERCKIVIGRKLIIARYLAPMFNRIGQCHLPKIAGETPAESLNLLLCLHLASSSLCQRSAAALIFYEWGRIADKSNTIPSVVLNQVTHCLESPPAIYTETTVRLAELSRMCTDFIEFCNRIGVRTTETISVTSSNQAESICARIYEQAKSMLNNGGAVADELNARWTTLSNTIVNTAPELQGAICRLHCFLAGSLTLWRALPDKLNPIIKPLMDGIKFETDASIAQEMADSLARMLILTECRSPCPNVKLIRNLVSLRTADRSLAPNIADWSSSDKLTSIISIYDEHSIDTKSHNAGLALQAICTVYGTVDQLTTRCTVLADYMHIPTVIDNQDAINSIEIWRTIYSCTRIFPDMDDQHRLWQMVIAENAATRNVACRLLLEMAKCQLIETLNAFLPRLLDAIDNMRSISQRLGAVELILLLSTLDASVIVGAMTLLAPAALGRMSDVDATIRQAASLAFSRFVRLMPLENGDQAITGASDELVLIWNRNRRLLTLLTDPTNLPSIDESLLVGLRAVQLRDYQRDGITWMWFLNRYRLHGILADDMGLGKTLQTLCVLAASHRQQKQQLPSLIVCPRTLVAHWCAEMHKYFDPITSPLRFTYIDSTSDWQRADANANVIVTAYETLRKDATRFAAQLWHYTILDEGHVIRNDKTQLFKAVAGLQCEHRLVLSGTPVGMTFWDLSIPLRVNVQNSVQELWTLFQFLMPGYLGTASQFNARFARPIAHSRSAKANSAEADAGTRALDTLHRLILPMTMRRLKTQVLKELPAKIVQDYYCTLTVEQTRIYTDITQSLIASKGASLSPLHVLIVLRKLIDHPCLVNDSGWNSDSSTSINQSGKMLALRQLLQDCGIGAMPTDECNKNDAIVPESSIGQHRALIFCQWKATVDLICTYLQDGDIGDNISFLRLDGTTPIAQRQSIVDRFNDDATIDILVLTTHVGGLGLNLIGADVVIFVDHDWNPVKDLQAIDRAHRLGQTRTVNVYRLITRHTLEEKIMRLQKFKIDTANALVGADNRSLTTMATDQLFELLTLDADGTNGENLDEPPTKQRRKRNQQNDLSTTDNDDDDEKKWNLEQLWDESQYEQAFNVDQFITNVQQSGAGTSSSSR